MMSARPDEAVPQTTGNNCNLSFKEIGINRPVDVSKCTPNQIKELKKACNRTSNIMVIMKDNKTVKYHRVNATIKENMFTCEELDWFTLSKENRSGTIEVWDSETHPTETECASTCNAIKPVTDPTKTVFTLNNPQCVKVCNSYVIKACNYLLKEKYGDKPITRINQIIYKMEQNNTFTYQCNFEYQL